jgi:hypothetical protein
MSSKEKATSTTARAARRDAVREIKRAAEKLRGRKGRELARTLRAVLEQQRGTTP